MCDFSISSEEIIEDNVNGILNVVSISTAQVSNLLCVDSCDDLLLWIRLNRKDLFEVPNKLFVVCLHCSDDEFRISSYNNQNTGVQGENESHKGYNVILTHGEDEAKMAVGSST